MVRVRSTVEPGGGLSEFRSLPLGLRANLLASLLLFLVACLAGAWAGWGASREMGVAASSPPPLVSPDWINIALHNLRVVGYAALGLFTLGIASVLVLMVSGFAFGLFSATSLSAEFPWHELLLLTLPHAVFEFAGLGLAAACGLEGFSLARGRIPFSWAKQIKVLALAAALTIVGAWIEDGVTIGLIGKWLYDATLTAPI